jgi:hypothetical protein
MLRLWSCCVLFLLVALAEPSIALAEGNARLSFLMKSDAPSAMGEIAALGMRRVFVSGPIADGDTDRFLNFVRSHNLDAAWIEFDSPGGSLLEGMKFGRVIRQRRFFTGVGSIDDHGAASNAVCASACAYAFAGGVSRFLNQSSGKLGIHQFQSSRGLSESDAQLVSGVVVSYLRDMGVDSEAFAVASVTNPSGITWLTPKEAEELGLANNGADPTTAEVKVVEMHPYLRLNQDKYSGTIRALFNCGRRGLVMQAGIITDPEQSKSLGDSQWQKRSYVEMDGREALIVNGAGGAKPNDSAVWLVRGLTRKDAADLLRTNELGVWIDGFGAVRAGGTIDLKAVRPAMTNYFTQCFANPPR